MLRKIIIITLILLFGCVRSELEISRLDIANTTKHINEIVYIKDSKTQLCFATFNLGTTYGGFTNVPCDKAEKFLIK